MPLLGSLGAGAIGAYRLIRSPYIPGTPSYLGNFIGTSNQNIPNVNCSSVQVNDLVIVVYGTEGFIPSTPGPAFTLGAQSLTAACYIDNNSGGSVEEATGIFYCIATSAIAGLTNLTLNAIGASSPYRAAMALFTLRGSSINQLVATATNKATSSYSTSIQFSQGILFQAAYSNTDWTSLSFTNAGTTVQLGMGTSSSEFAFAYNFSPVSISTSIGYTATGSRSSEIAYSAAVFR